MRADERMLRLIAATLPVARRSDRLEEWLADLDGSRELGLSRSSVVLGALRLGATENRLAGSLTRPRTWLVGGAVTAGIVVLGVPAAALGATIFDSALGVVTVETAPDGTERTVAWRTYPGVSGLDPADVLAGPSPEEGIRLGATITGEIRDALGLDWVEEDLDQVIAPADNHFGGMSMLVTVNSPAWQSTTSPDDQSDAMHVVLGILASHGFTQRDPHATSWWAEGPSGQWISFSWTPTSVAMSYGANALLPAGDRAEFERRVQPFLGYPQPAPLAS